MRVPPQSDLPSQVSECFEALYRSMAQRSLAYFTRRTADPEVARDLWAETWARAYASRDRFRGSTREQREAWVLGIGRKVLAGHYRRGAVERRAIERLQLERLDLDDHGLDRLERVAGRRALRHEIAVALAMLPALQAEALRLRVVHGLPYEEVARRSRVTAQVARARVSRA
ncbi:MAG TPA: RNA polymerase sigma factor, partial [Solirubrobacteraceae bacterium]|nr:RNA polymerase sigma factor [Solirubrobacteraceae bacterium]